MSIFRYLNLKRLLNYKDRFVRSIEAMERFELDLDKSAFDKNNLMMLRNRNYGQRCFILGNGPSLNLDDIHKIRNEVTFASNKIYLIFEDSNWRPTYYTVEDNLVALQNFEEIEAVSRTTKLFPSFLVNRLGKRFSNAIYYNDLRYSIKDSQFPGFSDNICDGIYWGSTVVYSQIQLAVYMGFRTIYLLGVDFSFIVPSKKKGNVLISEGEINHFHKDYRKPGEKWNVPNLDVQLKAYTQLKNDYLPNVGVEIFNATRGGELEVFGRVDLDDLV